jgi:hypothetical protein
MDWLTDDKWSSRGRFGGLAGRGGREIPRRREKNGPGQSLRFIRRPFRLFFAFQTAQATLVNLGDSHQSADMLAVFPRESLEGSHPLAVLDGNRL